MEKREREKKKRKKKEEKKKKEVRVSTGFLPFPLPSLSPRLLCERSTPIGRQRCRHSIPWKSSNFPFIGDPVPFRPRRNITSRTARLNDEPRRISFLRRETLPPSSIVRSKDEFHNGDTSAFWYPTNRQLFSVEKVISRENYMEHVHTHRQEYRK